MSPRRKRKAKAQRPKANAKHRQWAPGTPDFSYLPEAVQDEIYRELEGEALEYEKALRETLKPYVDAHPELRTKAKARRAKHVVRAKRR